MNDKLKAYRDSLTQEQKSAALQHALEVRRENVKERKANEHLYKLSYLDESYWQTMAQEAKFKMPIYNAPCTTSSMRKVFRKLNVDCKIWVEDCALKNLQQWIDLNPKLTAYAFAGNILEWCDSTRKIENDSRV